MVEMLLGVNVATGYISVKLCAWTTEDNTPDWAKLDFHLTESDGERLYGESDREEIECFSEEDF